MSRIGFRTLFPMALKGMCFQLGALLLSALPQMTSALHLVGFVTQGPPCVLREQACQNELMRIFTFTLSSPLLRRLCQQPALLFFANKTVN